MIYSSIEKYIINKGNANKPLYELPLGKLVISSLFNDAELETNRLKECNLVEFTNHLKAHFAPSNVYNLDVDIDFQILELMSGE